MYLWALFYVCKSKIKNYQSSMKRRTFLSAGAALGLTPVMGMTGFAGNIEQQASEKRQYFEWIRYQLPLGNRQRFVENFYRDVSIPALNKAGINNVGVFNVKHGSNEPTLHVIIPHPSLESIVTVNDQLLNDQNFLQTGERVLKAPMSEMAFVTMEKTIMRAFTHLPTIVVPTQKKENKSRIFQVRTYESPSLEAAKRKIHMFNEGGEIAIFKKTGLQPILFGETIAGDRMPNLVYICAYDDFAGMDKGWAAFRDDPDWKKLSGDTFYADTVSRINDWIWTPASCSQI
jgi:hypothetical protein